MRVHMLPDPKDLGDESGVRRVVEAYVKHLPTFGVEFTDKDHAELVVSHASAYQQPDVLICHGLYWTADYDSDKWEYRANADIIQAARCAREITVPSPWVAEPFQRDMHLDPHIVPHGIEWEEWQWEVEQGGYVLWNKNRVHDVCDPTAVSVLAEAFASVPFVTTFANDNAPENIKVIGVVPHREMQSWVKGAAVYLSTTKETFGIGALEAMASGVPVLGFRQGGILETVQHGVNGYLAEPGDWQGLADGLSFCLEHQQVLGDNGREMARAWTWEAACEKLFSVLKLASAPQPPTVSIVIPCYNYGTEDKLGRALRSSLSQTIHVPLEIIIVDDGSSDGEGVRRIVGECGGPERGVKYIRQDNSGVAVARNRGIQESTGKYICCLDADDALEPDFIQRCVEWLEADPSLGIAYTRLKWVDGSGNTGVSDWPGTFDFEQQMARRNQVPTACVFRRDLWGRLGGYRQRYAPNGAGAEDAEFWLRIGAAGYGAVMATEEPLFIYSQGTGQVSGNKQYREVDWTAWHPWTQDGKHPFASVAKAKRWSHPVRQYDEPEVSVVIPIGPGHEKLVIDALDSLEAQTFRKWEAIVAWDSDENDYETLKAYPYVRSFGRDTLFTPMGAGHARNRAVEVARAPLLLFLDADDWLYPTALEKMLQAFHSTGHAVYTDYVGMAYVGDPKKLAPDLQQRIYHYDPADGLSVIGYKSFDYDCQRAQRQPEDRSPYVWNLITTLFPKAWHEELGGFDEGLKTWEDIDYWWRMARMGKCFTRVPEELVVYRFFTGTRRERGVELHDEVLSVFRDKYKEIPVTMCKNCGSNPTNSPTMPRNFQDRADSKMGVPMDDSQFVLCKFFDRSVGDKRIYGPKTGIDYKYRAAGDEFLVHKQDIEAAPEKFHPIETRVQAIAKVVAPPPPPTAIRPKREEMELPKQAPNRIIDLQTVPGVTAELAQALVDQHGGPMTIEDLAGLTEDQIEQTGLVGKRKAQLILKAAGKMAGK